jgi:hypothetical protein
MASWEMDCIVGEPWQVCPDIKTVSRRNASASNGVRTESNNTPLYSWRWTVRHGSLTSELAIISRIRRILTMIWHSELLAFWTLSIVWNSEYKKTQHFWNWICFLPQEETPTLLDPLERTNLNHWKILCFLVCRSSDDGQSPETQYFWALYTIIRIL